MKDGSVFRYLSVFVFSLVVLSLGANEKDFSFVDPLRPYGTPDAVSPLSIASQTLQIQAVIMSELRGAYVVINNEPLVIGEMIAGFVITDITSDHIELLHKEKKERLTIAVPKFSSDVEKMLEGVRRQHD